MPVIHALGATVRVDLGDAIDPDEFQQAWTRCLGGPEDPDAETVGPTTTMVKLTQDITHALIRRRRGELLMLHAGAVCHSTTGASIAYAAPGGTGKTTLTHLLGQRYGYLTDETVGIEPDTRRIVPYPKPLSMRTPEGGYPKTERGPDQLGLLPPHPMPTLTTLCILRRTPGRSEASATRMELLEAITTLSPETSSLARLPQPLHLLAQLEEDLGGIWLLEFGESEQLVDWVTERLGEP